jgi:hypothetical protein
VDSFATPNLPVAARSVILLGPSRNMYVMERREGFSEMSVMVRWNVENEPTS